MKTGGDIQPMPGADLVSWRMSEGLSQRKAADLLGISVRSILTYEKPGATVPRVVQLAIFAMQLRVIADAIGDFRDSLDDMADGFDFIANQIKARVGVASTAQPQESEDDGTA